MDAGRVAVVALAAGFLFSASRCLAQSTRPEALAQGSILIMQRDVPDPIFSHSVIVLAHYDNSGAVGLMIHYRSNVTIQRALAGIAGAEKRTDTLFVGGPVEMEGVMALLRSDSPPEDASRVAGKLYLMTSKQGIAAHCPKGGSHRTCVFSLATQVGGPASWPRGASGRLVHLQLR